MPETLQVLISQIEQLNARMQRIHEGYHRETQRVWDRLEERSDRVSERLDECATRDQVAALGETIVKRLERLEGSHAKRIDDHGKRLHKLDVAHGRQKLLNAAVVTAVAGASVAAIKNIVTRWLGG